MAMRSARDCRVTAVTGVYRSLIAGGTRGLGRSIAKQSMRRDIEPVVLGRPRPDRSSTIEIDGEAVRFEPVRIEDDADVSRCIDRFKVTPSLNFRELFYLPGEHLKGRFCDQPEAAVRHMVDVTLFGLMNLVRHFHPMKKKPYRLITVASTTSWRIRPDEAAYGAAKAAAAQFARNIHQEIVKDLPDATSLIVHPGGMRTGFWPHGVDTSMFMDTDVAARLIWEEMEAQDRGQWPALHELHILRGPDGQPILERGPKAPQ
jgi:NAD(P)-dependent dehydrogenase (short-subunit alcohol dehydrogenase family)